MLAFSFYILRSDIQHTISNSDILAFSWVRKKNKRKKEKNIKIGGKEKKKEEEEREKEKKSV